MLEAVYARAGDTFKVFLINGITSKPCAHVAPNMEQEFVFHVNIDEVVPMSDIVVEMNGFRILGATDMSGTPLTVLGGDSVEVPHIGLYDVITIETA
jgi:hypothetical protein